MKIRKKLMTFFLILILLMSSITIYVYQISQNSVNQYDDILQRFLVLNEISQVNNELHDLFNDYFLVPSDSKIDTFEDYKEEFLAHQQEFNELIAPESDVSMSKNYYHMMAYLIDRMENAYLAHGAGETMQYFQYRDDATKVSTWINDTTLMFINNELEQYHKFHHDLLLQNQYNLSIALGAATLILLGCLVIGSIFYQRITDPIEVLVKQSKELSAGNFDLKDIPVTRDEMGVLARTFNTMKNSIHQLIKEMKHRAELESQLKEQKIKNMETTHLLKEMELKTLQNQINPHFLFNTLNTVSKMAYIEGAEESSELIVSISKLLRYNLKKIDKPVTLEDELNNVREYICIQKSRFGNRIAFDMDISTSQLDIPIPLLTLQPLVENAFIHGVDTMEEGGRIVIIVEDTGTHVQVVVTDNGEGMDETCLKRIKEEMEQGNISNHHGDTTRIGMSNVYKRLALLYESDGIMEIESNLGKGTKITLNLPKHNFVSKEVVVNV
ncbi:sensor histidine kinase YesM [Evansella vedderi]|uniref:histidine kinase n=1 Tax=Evansella vedderi TaxID=38282 RepID=A0ABT9ZQA6_9BACI|nr:histidine kinase [Evansella vedderi]MDQ0253426.1 sensor histidine kinase YesM [Evansella vedderi]